MGDPGLWTAVNKTSVCALDWNFYSCNHIQSHYILQTDSLVSHMGMSHSLDKHLKVSAGFLLSKKMPLWEYKTNSYLLVGLMKVKDISWFQKGSFSDMDSVPTRVLRLWLLDRSLIWLVLAPISAPSSQPNTLRFTVLTRHMKNSAGQDMLNGWKNFSKQNTIAMRTHYCYLIYWYLKIGLWPLQIFQVCSSWGSSYKSLPSWHVIQKSSCKCHASNQMSAQKTKCLHRTDRNQVLLLCDTTHLRHTGGTGSQHLSNWTGTKPQWRHCEAASPTLGKIHH